MLIPLASWVPDGFGGGAGGVCEYMALRFLPLVYLSCAKAGQNSVARYRFKPVGFEVILNASVVM